MYCVYILGFFVVGVNSVVVISDVFGGIVFLRERLVRLFIIILVIFFVGKERKGFSEKVLLVMLILFIDN